MMSAKQLLEKLEANTATDDDVLSELRAFSNECFLWGRVVTEFDGYVQVAIGEHDRLDCVSLALKSALYGAGIVERLLPPQFVNADEEAWTTDS